MDTNKLLLRQIKKHLTEDVIESTPGLSAFIDSVNESYMNFNHDIEMNERAFNIAEMEYEEINQKLNSEKETIERGIKRLSNMIRAIAPEFDLTRIDNQDDLLFIAGMLEEQVKKRKQVEKQLKVAIDKEIAASNIKSEFLATISHEIRSPLNVITSLSHILLAENHLKEQEENLEILKIASNSLMMLINDVLDFSKIESGKLELKKYSFDLHSLLKDILKGSKPLAKGKRLKFKLNLSDDLPRMVYSDSLRIKQILVNLISNALKFTEEGSVNLNVKLISEIKDSYLIQFEVTDTGIGIPENKLKEIFSEFYQVAKKHSRNGTGLGLSISKHLLNLLNSEIMVDSKEGVGSKFFFKIYLEKGEQIDINEEDSKTAESLFGMSILIVDDMAFNRIVIEKMLKKWNLKLDFAEHGIEAVEKVKQRNYDLVLMDVHMPKMDGIEATKTIRTFNQDTFIVALTASSDEKTKERVFEAGMNNFITKPIIPNELHKIIKSRSKSQQLIF